MLNAFEEYDYIKIPTERLLSYTKTFESWDDIPTITIKFKEEPILEKNKKRSNKLWKK